MKKNIALIFFVGLLVGSTSCDRGHSVSVFLRTVFKTKKLEKQTAGNEPYKASYPYCLIENSPLSDTLGYKHRNITVYCYGDTLTYIEVIPALTERVDLTSKPTIVNLTIFADSVTFKIVKTAVFLYSVDKNSECGFKWEKLK